MATVFEYGGSVLSPSVLGWYATLFVHPTGGAPPDLCGGVIVGPNTVLTAGHCVANAESITVYPGSEGNGWWPQPGAYLSESLIASPLYDEAQINAAQNDVGVFTVTRPFKNSAMATIDMTGSGWASLADEAPLYSAGHGLTCNGGMECVSGALVLVRIPKVSTPRCQGDGSDQWPTEIVGESYCAGFENVQAAPQPCQVGGVPSFSPAAKA